MANEVQLSVLKQCVEVWNEWLNKNRTKRELPDEWVRAVNAHGGFGICMWKVSKNPADLKGLLQEYWQ